MSRKSCPACFGIGSYLGTEWVRDDSGVSIFKTITVRRACEVCEGTGRLPESDGHRHFCLPGEAVRRAPGIPEAMDRVFLGVLGVVLAGYIVFQFLKEPAGTLLGVKVTAAVAAAAVLGFLLNTPAGPARLVRRMTLALLLGAISGGVAFELMGR